MRAVRVSRTWQRTKQIVIAVIIDKQSKNNLCQLYQLAALTANRHQLVAMAQPAVVLNVIAAMSAKSHSHLRLSVVPVSEIVH
jgi:hypothetical protein